MNIKRVLAKNYINFRGWSSKQKYLVIESDDWGAIRMPSKEAYNSLLNKGVNVEKNYFTKYDCLESNDDMELLFELLTSFKDFKNNHACITALSLVANPDFNKIKQNDKQTYEYETIDRTYKNYPNHNRVLDLWKNEGITQNLLYPQFHGREHLNVRKWMTIISSKIEQEDLAFEKEVLLGIGSVGLKRNKFNYNAAFEYEDEEHKKEIEYITKDGLKLFKETFGFKSKSFAPSASIRGEHIDKVLFENDVEFHQLGQYFVPGSNGVLRKIDKFWGDKNKLGQIYWRRNAIFEPSRNPDADWVNMCLKDIAIAFRWGKPAVINSHRVNFSGGISEKNRDNSLRLLKNLLQQILQKWPDVQFINSEQLGGIIKNNK